MTKKYSQIGLHDALYIAAREYPGGIEALAQRMGVSPNVLRNKLQPGIETHHTTLENFAEIVELLDPIKPDAAELAVNALLWRLGRVSVRLPHGEDVDNDRLLLLVADLFSHDGQVAELVRKALADDNKISDKELDEIEKGIQESSEALMTLLHEVREKHAADNVKTGARH
jgi:hypothetical protein